MTALMICAGLPFAGMPWMLLFFSRMILRFFSFTHVDGNLEMELPSMLREDICTQSPRFSGKEEMLLKEISSTRKAGGRGGRDVN